MKTFAPAHLLLALALAVAAGCATPVPTASTSPVPAADVVPGEVVVRWAAGADAAVREATRFRVGAVDMVAIAPGAERWRLAAADAPRALATLAKDPAVEFAHANPRRRLVPALEGLVPETPRFAIAQAAGDPGYSQQWHLPRAKFPDAWGTTRGQGVIVAVIDSGVDPNHPDLKANLLPLIDEVVAMGRHDVLDGTSYDDRDSHGHGTHVSGLVAAVRGNQIGVVGGAPEARILPVKVTPVSGDTDDATIAKGITDAVDKGARVLNLSIGGPEPSPILLEALNYGIERGAVAVIASGNDGGKVNYPAAYAGVIAVGAVVESGAVARYSSRGDGLVVVAPGGGQPGRNEGSPLYSSMPTYPTFGSRAAREGAGYGTLAGTSMAAPLVSAAAALILSASPGLAPAQVRTRLAATAKDGGAPGWDAVYGHGELDAAAAVQRKGDAGSPGR